MSELELSLLRARSMEILKQKARRGELFFTVAAGYVKAGRDKSKWIPTCACVRRLGWSSPALPKCKASARCSYCFAVTDSVAAHQPLDLRTAACAVEPPVCTTLSNLLTNPVYAGANAFGRTGSRTIIENGASESCAAVAKRSDWAVLLVDRHAICHGQTLKGTNG